MNADEKIKKLWQLIKKCDIINLINKKTTEGAYAN